MYRCGRWAIGKCCICIHFTQVRFLLFYLVFLFCRIKFRFTYLDFNNIYSYFREDMRNSFNFLLIALICMDSCYLIGAILESFRKCFYLASNAHLHLFPYFLYPGINIAGNIYRHNFILNLYNIIG